MALTLTAEQKSIYNIFSGDIKYLIPPYQRAYSWSEEQCSEFFEDIKESFLSDENDGYFIGNIVIAKSSEINNTVEVIDGQQRLITLTLFIKVLSELDPKNRALNDAMWITDRRDIDKKEQRVQTKVFEDKDSKFLKEVLAISLEEVCSTKGHNNFNKNICFFYKELKKTIKENEDFKIEDFSNYLLDKVSLLPIESTDSSQDKAREKALKIFETINNRGKPLSDSDIFKANLYSMALNDGEHDTFIQRWEKLDYECESIALKGFDILRVFKIYSYMIRGKEKIDSSEIGLRSFFTKKEYSPFSKKKPYSEIMDDLFKIVKSIQFYEKIIVSTVENNELSKYFQLIDIYTNNYPKDLLIVFLVKNNNSISLSLDFSKRLVKYCYYKGSTAKIKYTIYNWTVKVMNNEWSLFSPAKDGLRHYTYFGKLYKGFGLLSTYLQEDIEAVYPYHIKRLRDVTTYKYEDYSIYDKIGHTVVQDTSGLIMEDYDFNNLDDSTYNKRIKDIETRLKNFLENVNENVNEN
ncbi:MAG: DUF262 domain-containing protein [Sulfurovum sp.]|nr:DUF262 domain-containing protein [Sulfurovum sp.]